MRVRLMKSLVNQRVPRPVTSAGAARYVARQEYEVVVDPLDGEPVRVVTSVEWDDEHKALVLRCD